jgi:TRAP-type mannitol/chloroaromatic compound transport system substrate-binding protein
MKRRNFLSAVAGAAAGAIAAPAVAQTRSIRWRLTSSFPKSLDVLFGGAQVFAQAVAEATDNNFQIDVLAPGEVAPALQALDAVSNASVDMCQTAAYYYANKDPVFVLACAMPFGLNTRMQNAWLLQHGGNELLNDFFVKYNVTALPAGNTGCQMGGWFRKEIAQPADLNGLKFRIGGFAAAALQKLGVVPQQVAGGDIYSALEKGNIDGAEWVGPYDDEKLRFQAVAPYYYYPAWWEGGTVVHHFINLDRWNELPKSHQRIVRSACDTANLWMTSRYDELNPAALKRLIAAGAMLRPFPQPVLEACLKAANELYAETAANNGDFKKIYENLFAYRSDQYLWWQVAEYNYDTFMIRSRPRGG